MPGYHRKMVNYILRAWDAYNNVVLDPSKEAAIEVAVETLDENENAVHGTFIKIDVEGFELPVLKGANKVLSNPLLNSIIVELNESGERYGHKDSEIDNLLKSHGFSTYQYKPFTRELVTKESFTNGNNIYIRDIEKAREKIKQANKITILGISY